MENVNNNKNIIGDNNNVSNSNINSNIITNIYPKIQSIKEKEKERERKQRPYLSDKEGKLVKGYGFVVRNYNDDFITVINLTDLNGVYIADHIQLNIKENIYNYEYKSNFIQFEGYVYSYKRVDGSIDYSINISNPVIFLSSSVDNCNFTEKYFDMTLDIEKFLKYFYKAEYNDLFRLLKKLSERLDKLTIEFGKRFVYNNIINNFMLYNATYDLYKEELQSNILNNEALVSLILIIASLIYQIESDKSMDIRYILTYIANACNLEQGIQTYNKQSKEFERFCNNIGILTNSKRLKKAWAKIRLRKYNFSSEVNPMNLDKNSLAESAYLILNDYI